jgi:hypothetical protein
MMNYAISVILTKFDQSTDGASAPFSWMSRDNWLYAAADDRIRLRRSRVRPALTFIGIQSRVEKAEELIERPEVRALPRFRVL